jgi:hypothetical protein
MYVCTYSKESWSIQSERKDSYCRQLHRDEMRREKDRDHRTEVNVKMELSAGDVKENRSKEREEGNEGWRNDSGNKEEVWYGLMEREGKGGRKKKL